MKRKNGKRRKEANSRKSAFPVPKSHAKGKKQRQPTSAKRRHRYSTPKNGHQARAHQKALAALAHMRRENISLSKAARLEHIKVRTFLRHVGSAVYRSGPGKPWKARKSDSLAATMRILTEKGPAYEEVRGSGERKRLAAYEIALRKFRAGEDGAEKELSSFRGLTVGGHVLVTDSDLLIHLEEAGQLDFDSLYFAVGGGT